MTTNEELHISPNQSIVKMKVSKLASMLNENEIQRVSSEQHIDEIYQSILSVYNQSKEIILTPLTVVDWNQMRYLIDGQHRFKAFLKLYKEMDHDQTLILNTISVSSQDEIHKLFNIINNSVPAAEVPEGISCKDKNRVMKYFTDKYPLIFSATKTGNVQRPHIHPTAFQEQIQKLLFYYPDSDELIRKMEELNNVLKDSTVKIFKNKGDTEQKLESLRSKATSKGKLYFGMFKNFECFESLYPAKIVKYRQKVPAALRDRVWNIYYSTNEGTCLFCTNTITKQTCHMAHDLAHSKGGDVTVANLYPSCATCNLSMGTRTYDEAVKWLELQRRI